MPAAPSTEPWLLPDGRRFFTFLFAQLHCVVFFYLFSTAQKLPASVDRVDGTPLLRLHGRRIVSRFPPRPKGDEKKSKCNLLHLYTQDICFFIGITENIELITTRT